MNRSGLGVGVGGVVVAIVSVASACESPYGGRVAVAIAVADSVAVAFQAAGSSGVDGGVGGDGPLFIAGSVVVHRKLRFEAL